MYGMSLGEDLDPEYHLMLTYEILLPVTVYIRVLS